jgi:hypothetical protein
MMGRLKSDQSQLFYEFHLSEAVPEDHLVRKIDATLDLPGFVANLRLDGPSPPTNFCNKICQQATSKVSKT